MKGIMFNTKYGLEQAVLNGSKIRTWRADQKPRYEVGEVIAIKQKYSDLDETWRVAKGIFYGDCYLCTEYQAGWNNKMFVKNELMPHKIKITGIKQCRLQDLTDEDCLREGVRKGKVYGFFFGVGKTQKKCLSPIDAFSGLINKLNGKGYWESNPDGYAYEFELVR